MKPTFKAQSIQVQVPATSANLGPGFDSLGLALSMHDRYIAQVLDEQIIDVDISGEGALDLPRNEKNLVIKAMYKGFEFLGGKPRGVALRALNLIPHSRGLGSSASAIVGGLSLARGLVLGGHEKMSDEDMLNLAYSMEGHPDNVAAAIFGGATIAWQEMQHGVNVALSVQVQVDPRITSIAFIPETVVSTSKARKMLPDVIPHAAATKNSANSALLIHALEHRPDLLFTATQDYLHQEYRAEAMPASFTLMRKLRAAGVAAFISGAGPSILVLHTGGATDEEELTRFAGDGFRSLPLGVSRSGAALISD